MLAGVDGECAEFGIGAMIATLPFRTNHHEDAIIWGVVQRLREMADTEDFNDGQLLLCAFVPSRETR